MHILNNLREYGPIYNTISLLIHVKEGTYMKFLEQFYIQIYNYKNELSWNSVLKNVTHYTKMCMTFNYVTLVPDLQNRVNCPRIFVVSQYHANQR